MAAFTAAIRMGADMIETDVRRTAGGAIVLAHDPLGARRARGLVELAELVELAAGRISLDVELKEAGYEADVLAVLEPRPPGLLVTSFIPEVVAAIHALDPGVETGLIFRPGDRRDLLARATDVSATAVVAHVNVLDTDLADAMLDAGRPLLVWTVNDRRRLASIMATPGVTHVVTDVPEVALAIRGP
jgi:glycerophosphoryl diester phosphodiesterase